MEIYVNNFSHKKCIICLKYRKMRDYKYPKRSNSFYQMDIEKIFKNEGITLYVSRGKYAPELYNVPILIDLDLNTAIELINNFENKKIVGAGLIINLPELKGDQKLISKGIKIHSLMEF